MNRSIRPQRSPTGAFISEARSTSLRSGNETVVCVLINRNSVTLHLYQEQTGEKRKENEKHFLPRCSRFSCLFLPVVMRPLLLPTSIATPSRCICTKSNRRKEKGETQ